MPELHELLLIRHAKSDWSDKTQDDIERPLAEKGKKQACKMGHWLAENQLIPQRILVSPATRAQQTLARLTRHWDQQPEIIQIPELYEAQLNELIQLLQQQPPTIQRIAIIGHNPELETLLQWLTGDPAQAHLATCAIAHLLIPGNWQQLEPAQARLLQRVSPKTV
jgi:phosphohistidine phosphatase